MDQAPSPAFPAPPTDTSPHPFSEIPGLWLKVTRMSEDFFAAEAPRASASNTVISILILAVAWAIMSSISLLIWTAAMSALSFTGYADTLAPSIGSAFLGLCSGLIFLFAAFYATSGLTYLGARVLGGTGSFDTQTYLASLSAVPMLLTIGLVGFIPCLGTIVALFLAVYATVLDVRSVKVAHSLTTGRAVAAIVVPMLIGPLLLCCCLGGLGLLVG